jgi:hypothetical protein
MHAEYKVPAGKLVVVDLDVAQGRLAQVRISGDFFLEPPEALDLINQAVTGLAADTSELGIQQALQKALPANVEMFGFSAADVAVVIRRALAS